MTDTAKLLRVFRVDQQLRGLRTRLTAAESFAAQQEKLLNDLKSRHAAASAELKEARTKVASDESETASIDARIAKIREQMNQTKTNKEYSAFLSELNSLKEQKDAVETNELQQMQALESLQKTVDDLTTQINERQSIVERAKTDCQTKHDEIRDRLTELKSQRDTLAAEVAPASLRVLEELIAARGDDAMAPVEVIDRRSHEWNCGACMMALTVETINRLAKGGMTRCTHCQCVLFTEEENVASKSEPKEPKAPKAPKAKVSKAKKPSAAPEAEASA